MICSVDICQKPLHGNTSYCRECYHNRWKWIKSGKDADLWLDRRISWLQRPTKFSNSHYAPLPPEERVITKKGGVAVNDTHQCRRCGEDKFIVNPTYHFCGSCAAKEMWIGYDCYVCNHHFDGVRSGRCLTDVGKIVCNNCGVRMKNYELDADQLRTLLSIDVCSVCECTVSDGKRGRHIDHDHDTGLVRGILCSNCNLAEGYVRAIGIDPVDWATRLTNYLTTKDSSSRDA